MITRKDIKWYLSDPMELIKMKPFTRGGVPMPHGFEGQRAIIGEKIFAGLPQLELVNVSQDLFLCEYDPTLHHIILNQSIPKIKVNYNGLPLPFNEITQTAGFQKIIHAAHTRNLATNPLKMSLCNVEKSDDLRKGFAEAKQEWMMRGRENDKYEAISKCFKCANVGVLFYFDTMRQQYDVRVYSYDDGYQIVPNYDEYGREIARSLVYLVDGSLVIDTYDAKYHYHIEQSADGEKWEIQTVLHGFPVCPLLHKRGLPAWHYAESTIELWEIMTNINAIALKRFGTFALVFIGEMDKESFKRDSSTLIINLSSDNTNGKQDAKTLEFPEPQTMDAYLKSLEEKISIFSSTSFITPNDIAKTGSGGNGIALAMSNDFALATQSAMDWGRFVNDMVYLHLCGLDLEYGTNRYSQLKIGAKIIPWSLETNNTKITNLSMERQWLSRRTIVENSPDAEPDEMERIDEETAMATQGIDDAAVDENAQKAYNLSVNKSDEIIDNY